MKKHTVWHSESPHDFKRYEGFSDVYGGHKGYVVFRDG